MLPTRGEEIGEGKTAVESRKEREGEPVLAPGGALPADEGPERADSGASRRIRVLLAENTIRGLGGSYESLFLTASALSRDRFEPIVLFFQRNHFVGKLEAQGVRVIVAKPRYFWETEAYKEKSTRVRSSLPRRGLPGKLRKAAVTVLRSLIGDLPMTWTVYKLLRAERIDILHTNNNLRRDAAMVVAGILARVPVVVHERQITRYPRITRLISAKVSAQVCISDAVLENTRTSGARTADRRRIHNAVDLAAFRDIPAALPPGPPRIGIVGRIMPRKGQRHFVEAAALIVKRFPPTEFYLIGGAVGEYQAYEEEVRALARSLGVEGSLRWTGYIEQPLGLMRSLDIVVHAAIEPEPFGRVIIEALALGKPVIATALGGPLEIIEDGVSGFLVPPRDPAALADRALRLLSDSVAAAEMQRAALRRAGDFGVAAYIHQIENVYTDVLARQGMKA